MITRPEGGPLGGVFCAREIQTPRPSLARSESRATLRHRGHPRERQSLPTGANEKEREQERDSARAREKERESRSLVNANTTISRKEDAKRFS